jgi:hypothetical protein
MDYVYVALLLSIIPIVLILTSMAETYVEDYLFPLADFSEVLDTLKGFSSSLLTSSLLLTVFS